MMNLEQAFRQTKIAEVWEVSSGYYLFIFLWLSDPRRAFPVHKSAGCQDVAGENLVGGKEPGMVAVGHESKTGCCLFSMSYRAGYLARLLHRVRVP